MAISKPTQKTEKINIWVSPIFKQRIYKEAQSKGMNISEYIRYMVRKGMGE